MKKLEEFSSLTEEDYGPFKSAATLYEGPDETFYLKVECGYSRPYDTAWYELSERPPEGSLEVEDADYAWADASSDQSEDFEERLGVSVCLLPENKRPS